MEDVGGDEQRLRVLRVGVAGERERDDERRGQCGEQRGGREGGAPHEGDDDEHAEPEPGPDRPPLPRARVERGVDQVAVDDVPEAASRTEGALEADAQQSGQQADGRRGDEQPARPRRLAADRPQVEGEGHGADEQQQRGVVQPAGDAVAALDLRPRVGLGEQLGDVGRAAAAGDRHADAEREAAGDRVAVGGDDAERRRVEPLEREPTLTPTLRGESFGRTIPPSSTCLPSSS